MARALTIREAKTGDVSAIQCVARSSWHAAYLDILGTKTIESFLSDWYEAGGLHENVSDPEHEFLVAARDGGVIGFVHASPSNEEPYVAVLSRLYVDPDYWNEGTGGTLLARIEYLLDERGFERLQLRVLAENTVGVAFYESVGFERVELRETELDGETYGEYVYEKEL